MLDCRPFMKIKFYIISLIVLFSLSVVIDFKILDSEGEFLSWPNLLIYNWFSILSIALIVVGLVFLFHQKHEFKGVANPCYQIEKLENVNYEFLTFLTTYIIPLICFDFDKERYKFVFFIILIIIGIVFVKMDLYLANPILALMGYRLYRINVKNEARYNNIIVISTDKLSQNDSIEWIPLDKNCWYVRRRENGVKGIENDNK